MATQSDTLRHRLGTATLLLFALAALVAIVLNAPVAYAGVDTSFEWSGPVASGKVLEIKTVNGSIEARAATGTEVMVHATKRWRHDDPEEVSIEVIEHEDGVTFCTLYPGWGNNCEPGRKGSMRVHNNDVTVDYVVEVPRGVLLTVRTVNGAIQVEGVDSHVTANTVNGSVDVESKASVRAETVNGSIHASMGAAHWEDKLKFSTVNGRIELLLPSATGAEVRAQTVNGSIHTDLPLKVKGFFGMRSVRGTIGGGGGMLSLNTVNGSIRLNTR